jgi:hypothetical protein
LLYKDSSMDHKWHEEGRKDLNSTKWIKGEKKDWKKIPLGAWMSVCCECCVLSGRGLCVGLVTRPEESYRVWCVWVWSWSLEKWGGLGPQGAVDALGEKNVPVLNEYQKIIECCC